MIRSQIYLTEDERSALQVIAKQTGRTQSDLIREAVDSLIEKVHRKDSYKQRQAAFGIWQDREDLPDVRELRQEFDRTF